MAGTELGKAYISVVPSMRGVQKTINSEFQKIKAPKIVVRGSIKMETKKVRLKLKLLSRRAKITAKNIKTAFKSITFKSVLSGLKKVGVAALHTGNAFLTLAKYATWSPFKASFKGVVGGFKIVKNNLGGIAKIAAELGGLGILKSIDGVAFGLKKAAGLGMDLTKKIIGWSTAAIGAGVALFSVHSILTGLKKDFADIRDAKKNSFAPQSVKDFVKSLDSVEPKLERVRQFMEGKLLAGLGPIMEQRINEFLPQLYRLAGGVGVGLNVAVKNVSAQLSGVLEGAVADGSFNKAVHGMAQTIGALGTVVGKIMATISQAMISIAPGMAEAAKGLMSGLSPVFSAIMPLIKSMAPVFLQVGQAIGSAFKQLGPVIAPLINLIGQELMGVIKALLPIVQPLVNVFSTFFKAMQPAIAAVVPVLIQLANILSGTLVNVLNQLTPILPELANAFIEILNALLPLLPPLLQLASIFLTELAVPIIIAFARVFSVVAQALAKVASILTALLVPALKALGDGLTVVSGWIKTLSNLVVGTFVHAWDSVKGKLDTVKNVVVDLATSGFNVLYSAIQSVIGALKEAWGWVQKGWGKIKGIFGGHANGGLVVAGHAAGGVVSGPGTGTSDSILGVGKNGMPTTRVSNGEYVVNAKSTKKYLPLLNTLNQGDVPLSKISSGVAKKIDTTGGGTCECIKKSIDSGVDKSISATKSVAKKIPTNSSSKDFSVGVNKVNVNGKNVSMDMSKGKPAGKHGSGGGKEKNPGELLSKVITQGKTSAFDAIKQTTGFDGSVFSDPTQWANVKSVMGFADAAFGEGMKGLKNLFTPSQSVDGKGKTDGMRQLPDLVVDESAPYKTPSGAKLEFSPTSSNPILNQSGTGAGADLGGVLGAVGDAAGRATKNGVTQDNSINISNSGVQSASDWRNQARKAQASRTRNSPSTVNI